MRASGQTCQPAQQRQSSQSDGSMRLSIDWVETDDRYTLYADVPGLQKSDLKVSLAFTQQSAARFHSSQLHS